MKTQVPKLKFQREIRLTRGWFALILAFSPEGEGIAQAGAETTNDGTVLTARGNSVELRGLTPRGYEGLEKNVEESSNVAVSVLPRPAGDRPYKLCFGDGLA